VSCELLQGLPQHDKSLEEFYSVYEWSVFWPVGLYLYLSYFAAQVIHDLLFCIMYMFHLLSPFVCTFSQLTGFPINFPDLFIATVNSVVNRLNSKHVVHEHKTYLFIKVTP